MRLKKQLQELEKRVAALEVEAQKRQAEINYSVKIADGHANDLIVEYNKIRHVRNGGTLPDCNIR